MTSQVRIGPQAEGRIEVSLKWFAVFADEILLLVKLWLLCCAECCWWLLLLLLLLQQQRFTPLSGDLTCLQQLPVCSVTVP
jgi:hypothetical protein